MFDNVRQFFYNVHFFENCVFCYKNCVHLFHVRLLESLCALFHCVLFHLKRASIRIFITFCFLIPPLTAKGCPFFIQNEPLIKRCNIVLQYLSRVGERILSFLQGQHASFFMLRAYLGTCTLVLIHTVCTVQGFFRMGVVIYFKKS